MSDMDIRREQLRHILEQAEVEISSALGRLDQMGPYELAELRGATAGLEAAIYDKNGSCAAIEGRAPYDPLAFYDKNGSCSSDALRSFDPAAIYDKNGSCAAIDPNQRQPTTKKY